MEQLHTFQEQRNAQSTKSKNKIGPYVAVVGDLSKDSISDENIDINNQECTLKIFVVINSMNFEVTSNNIVEAVNFCYKSFFALLIDFTPESKHLWAFFQIYIYETNLATAKYYTCVQKFIDSIKKYSVVTSQ